jgi:sulfur-carrier protein adenylyltransferase/sulfurtransferase
LNPPELPLEISVAEASRIFREQSRPSKMVDVREASELQICRVDGALHIPMSEIPQRSSSLPRDQPLLILCHHGGRSLAVTKFLRANGFPQAINVSGGIEAWAEEIDPSMRRY